MGEIYKITNLVNGKCYVGKTKHAAVIRWRDHINGYHPSSAIHNAIKKYGVEKFSFEVIESDVSKTLLNELEEHYITKFNSKAPHGYNLTDGGDGGSGLVVSEATKKKLSEVRRGKPWSEKRRASGQQKLSGNNHAGKRVAMISNGTVIELFASVTEASIKTGIYRTNISRSCLHSNLKAGGYHWQFM